MPEPSPIGHNSKLTEGERKALFTHHLGLIQRQRAVVVAAQAVEKTLRKEAKVDGLVLGDIDFGMRVATIEDDSIIGDELNRRMEIASWLGMPIGYQPDLFQLKKDTSAKMAGRAGRAAGMTGAERKAPHDAGTPEEQAWLTEYDAAQKQAGEDLITAMNKKTQERLAAARRSGNGKAADPQPDAGKKEPEAVG